MDTSIQNALQDLVKEQATSDELELLRQALASGQIFIGGNVQNSVIIVGSGNSVQLTIQALERLDPANNFSALHQLPQPPADFVGREDELKNILANINESKGATISGLTGMGGIGKTALGLIAAHELVTRYSDAQFFIDLRGTTKTPLQPFDVMKHVIQSVDPTRDLRNIQPSELAGAYHSYFSENKAILFLDNASDAGQVIPLLPPPSSCVFITSRWQFPVPGLDSLHLNVLKEDDAIQLLIGLCSRITEENAKQLAALCGYLPIALRVAGGYLQVNADWSPEEYIAELSKKNERLKALRLKRSEINIDYVFTQSYQRLTRNEQKYWRMMAVFPAPFDRDALADVWGLDDVKAHRLASVFCRYNLMEYDSIKQRYRLHDLLTDFANKKLREPTKGIYLFNYFAHYHKIWYVVEDLYGKGGNNVIQGLLLFDNEFLHIKTSTEWAISIAGSRDAVSTILKDIPETIYATRLRLHPELQIRWFQAMLTAAEKLGDRYNQNKLLGNIGAAYATMGEARKAIDYYEQALQITLEINDILRQGFWSGNIGAAYANLGENRRAIQYQEQALEIARQIGDRQRQGFWLGNIGVAYDQLGEMQKAIGYYEQALAIARELGNHRSEAGQLGNLGGAYISLGEWQTGVGYYEQALNIARDLGDRENESSLLGSIGDAYANLGDQAKSIEFLEQALTIAREMGDRKHEGYWLGSLGLPHIDLNKIDEGIRYYEQALAIARELGDHQHEGLWLGNMGEAYTKHRETDKGLDYLDQALAIAREIGDQQNEGCWLGSMGEAYSGLGKFHEAREYLMQALLIARKIGDRKREGLWLQALGELDMKLNNFVQARENLELALSVTQDLNLRALEKNAWQI